MTRYEHAQLLLNEMAQSRGLEALPLDDHAYCALVTPDEQVLHIHYDEELDAFLFLGALGEAPALDADPAFAAFVYARLLEANLYWDQTLGATLAREKSGYLVLQQLWPATDGSSAKLGQFVDTFAELLSFWRERVTALAGEYQEPVQPFEMRI